MLLALVAPLLIMLAGTLPLDATRRGGEQLIAYEFALGSRARVSVDVADIDVWVQAAEDGVGRVEFYTSGTDVVRVRDYLENELRCRVVGDTRGLVVESQQPRARDTVEWKSHGDIEIWAVITVPRMIDANIATRKGDIQADALEGELELTATQGDVVVGEMSGTLKVESKDGDVSVEAFGGERMEAETTDGNFRAGMLRVEVLAVQSSGGSIIVPDVVAGSVAVRARDGDVTIGVETRMLRVSCANGDMVVELRGPAEADLRGRNGDIQLTLPRSLNVNLDLQAEAVSSRGALDLRGRFSDRYIHGALNGGGPLVGAETSGGRIVLYVTEDH